MSDGVKRECLYMRDSATIVTGLDLRKPVSLCVLLAFTIGAGIQILWDIL